MSGALADLIAERRTIVCVGSGGVGKTTTAAVLAMEAARRGRRSVVVTIDPAKRLADAMGLGSIGNDPAPVSGEWPGELWAVMLDTKATFDVVVARHAADDTQRDRILSNPFYRNIAGALSGTHEYMAAEKLYELHWDPRFDLVVVDTPPSRNAIDFLDAPRRLTNFLDHRLYRTLTAPNRGPMRAVNVAAQAFVRAVARVAGAAVIDDAIAFFQAFDGMEAGFRHRAEGVQALLADERTAYVLVAGPRRDTVAEARFLAEALADWHLDIDAVVVNRMHPAVKVSKALAARAAGRTDAIGSLVANAVELSELRAVEDQLVDELVAGLGTVPVVRVPLLGHDVADLASLDELARHLV